MNLESFTKNQFSSIKASITRREKFLNYHLIRMEANNSGGLLNGIIAETKPLHLKLVENLSIRSNTLGTGKGSTLSVRLIMTNFIGDARNLESMCKIKFGKKSPIYLEAFPQGFSEYQNVTQGEFKPLLQRVITFSIKYQTEIGPDFVEKFKNQLLQWDDKLAKREDIAADALGVRPAFETLWDQIVKQLYKNLLTILLANLTNPSAIFIYFDESLVRFRHHTTDDTTDDTYKLLIPALTSKAAEISFAVDDTLLVINNGAKSIFYYGAATANEQAKTALIEIPAGEEAEVTAVSLGVPTNKFIIFVNKDATEEAEVEIALI